MSRRAVFLDRDGVLVDTAVRGNHPYAALSLDDFRIGDGVAAEIERLRALGLLRIVVTNQPEVTRGALPPATLEAMHARLRSAMPLDGVMVCPHVDADRCACRKPKPGLLVDAAAHWDIDLARSFVVGDRWRDVDCGRAVGAYTILLERPYSGDAIADARVSDLHAAVDRIAARIQG